MAKKRNRRTPKSTVSGRRPPGQRTPTPEEATPAAGEKLATRPARTTARESATQTRKEATAAQLAEDYGYVAKDLRRLLLLAALMFALLIALNLILSR
jgi:hypothetical protein